MVSDKVNIYLSYNPSLGICLREIKAVHKKTFTRMFIAALFITAPNWKQPPNPSVIEQISRLPYSYIMWSWFNSKKPQTIIYTIIWRNLENLLSERSQTQKTT